MAFSGDPDARWLNSCERFVAHKKKLMSQTNDPSKKMSGKTAVLLRNKPDQLEKWRTAGFTARGRERPVSSRAELEAAKEQVRSALTPRPVLETRGTEGFSTRYSRASCWPNLDGLKTTRGVWRKTSSKNHRYGSVSVLKKKTVLVGSLVRWVNIELCALSNLNCAPGQQSAAHRRR